MTKNRPKAVRKKTSVTSRILKASSVRPAKKPVNRVAVAKKQTTKRTPAKRSMHPLLAHHRHTGKRLPIHHSSFAVLGLIVLLLGILLTSISLNVNAADLAISAKVSAPLPTIPAVMTSPADQEVFIAIPIVVNGTCDPDQLVKLYDNGAFSGSVLCSSTGDFTLSTDLDEGSNSLQTKIFNLTDDEGPPSSAITVFFNPPHPTPTPTPIPTPTSTSNATPQPTPSKSTSSSVPHTLSIGTSSTYVVAQVGEPIEITLEATGGKPPYSVDVDWGDGGSNTYTGVTYKKLKISYIYDNLGNNQGKFNIRIKLTDEDGQKSFLQIAAVIREAQVSSIPGSTPISSTTAQRPLGSKLTFAWYGYAGLLIALISFWLGSRWIVKGTATKVLHKH